MSIRLNKVIKEFNVGLQTVVDFLTTKGFEVKASPSEKISDAQYDLLRQEFGADRDLRAEAEKMIQNRQKEKIQKEKKASRKDVATEIKTEIPTELRPKVKVMGTIDLNQKKADDKTSAQKQVKDEETKEVAHGNTVLTTQAIPLKPPRPTTQSQKCQSPKQTTPLRPQMLLPTNKMTDKLLHSKVRNKSRNSLLKNVPQQLERKITACSNCTRKLKSPDLRCSA